MLEVLCGNKNVQKVLLFLFVNGKCYGTQLRHLLQSSLTPIQKALLRLEKGGVILSNYEGKTRLYQFNPSYPLLPELEQLLKKAYTLLPPSEKKLYSSSKERNTLPVQALRKMIKSCTNSGKDFPASSSSRSLPKQNPAMKAAGMEKAKDRSRLPKTGTMF